MLIGRRMAAAHRVVGPVAVSDDGSQYVREGDVLTHGEDGHIVTDPVWYRVVQQREHVPLRAPTRRWD